MTTDWRSFGPDMLTPALRAALGVFVREGYHGTSIRSIAGAAGLSVPGLYHHHRSKQAILDAIVTATMTEMLAHSHAAEDDSDGTARGRFDNLVEALVRFHMERRDHAFLASTEMRSMDPQVLARHIAQRDEQQRLLEAAISDGVADGSFVSAYPADAARAVSSLCVSIATWYRPDGPLTEDEVIERHLDFARRIVGAA
ncbi:TetR/AcrR family transcriptional regulator [Janibacter cremeus]|nr:TetR/AcrR family transcriptional regulator [Janibacter cremeus]